MRDTDIKYIYNTFLRISRQKQNKPFKLRENFEGFDKTEYYLPVLRLKNFFDRNYSVNIEDFFTAPYEVYEDEDYYGIDFYSSMAAIKVYNIFCSKRNQLDPDTDIQINNILRGLKHIKEYCIKNNIMLEDYLEHFEPGAVTKSFIVHLKEKNISPYNLFPFKNFDKVYSKLDFEVLKFILNDIPLKMSIYRGKFYASKKGKSISVQGLKAIEKTIKETLEKSKNHNTITI